MCLIIPTRVQLHISSASIDVVGYDHVETARKGTFCSQSLFFRQHFPPDLVQFYGVIMFPGRRHCRLKSESQSLSCALNTKVYKKHGNMIGRSFALHDVY